MEKTKRGFAGLDPQRRSEIASMGGRAAHKLGVAHQFTTEEARAAGRKGGSSKPAARAGVPRSETASRASNNKLALLLHSRRSSDTFAPSS